MGILVSFPEGHIIEYIEQKPALQFDISRAIKIAEDYFKENVRGNIELARDRKGHSRTDQRSIKPIHD